MNKEQEVEERYPADEIVEVFNQEITHILQRIDLKISSSNVTRWLNNFEDNDRMAALEILTRLRFVSEREQFVIANELILEILEKVEVDTIFYFCPIAKYGKSATQFSYYIAKSPAFQNLERQERSFFLMHEVEIQDAKFNDKSVVVFFDDFFGSGGSFKSYYDDFTAIASPDFAEVKHIFAACGLYMERAEAKIQRVDHRIIIIGELHDKIFGNPPAMFVSQSQIDEKKELSKRYGDRKFLFKGRTRNHSLGYKDSEALLAFPYMPPNNTLPIIWSSNSDWYALLPRAQDDIFRKLKEYKLQLSYAAAKISLELPSDFDKFYNLTDMKFIIFGILRMINQKIPHPQIARVMGINLKGLNVFMDAAQNMKYIDENYNLTQDGMSLLEDILEQVRIFKEQKKENNTIRGMQYMPKKIPRV